MIRQGRVSNVLLSDGDMFVITVNELGAMGKGNALSLKNAFPWAYAYYRTLCGLGEDPNGHPYEKRLHAGDFHAFDRGEGAHPRYIGFAATKADWRNPSKPEYLDNAADAMLQWLNEHPDVQRVGITPWGAVNGGLPRDVVDAILQRRLGNDARVFEMHDGRNLRNEPFPQWTTEQKIFELARANGGQVTGDNIIYDLRRADGKEWIVARVSLSPNQPRRDERIDTPRLAQLIATDRQLQAYLKGSLPLPWPTRQRRPSALERIAAMNADDPFAATPLQERGAGRRQTLPPQAAVLLGSVIDREQRSGDRRAREEETIHLELSAKTIYDAAMAHLAPDG
ncbi:MAG TPA: hypothetical protein VKR05_02075, partial [Candidatus Cybelea sp.]|nr:hypothetical protein [Candidatus Cybelea sp.]